MASRSAGTGIISALVTFVVLTVLSAVAAIYFYSAMDKAEQEARRAQEDLARVATSEQLGREEVRKLMAAASPERMTLVEYLMTQKGQIAALVAGDPNADAPALRSALSLAEGQTVRAAIDDARRQLRAKSDEAEGIKASVSAAERAADLVKAQAKAQVDAAKREVEEVRASIEPYKQAGDRHQVEIDEVKQEYAVAREELENTYKNRFSELQQQIDASNQEVSLLRTRTAELQKQVDQFRIKPKDASLLVDGRIVDASTSSDRVYISLGAKDRVRPGMTFEVYDDAAAIQYDPATQRQTSGKASIEVVRVGETTSVARVTRQRPGRPIVREDVIANAVYSPDYRYKFLVHGKFDVDADGTVSDSEADYIRGKISEWGGEVVSSESITGDLDFVVVGSQPPMPVAPSLGASQAQFDAFFRARAARESYDNLISQARDAGIPVLNWNRFRILTGAAER
jgi:hypothetical protein